jgi:hypothetical protein
VDILEVTGPAFVQLDEGRYRLSVPKYGLVFEVDRLRRERHELHGELTVTTTMAGARAIDGVLSTGTFNLSSPTARTHRAKDRSSSGPVSVAVPRPACGAEDTLVRLNIDHRSPPESSFLGFGFSGSPD